MRSSATIIHGATGLACILAGGAAGADGQMSVTGSVQIASDYIFRGVSQTYSAAAVQASLEADLQNGIYAYVWLSNVDFVDQQTPDDGADFEVNLAAGYVREVGKTVSIDARVVHYSFPGTVSGIDYDYNELIATVWLGDVWRATVAYTNDVFGEGEPGVSYTVGAELELPGDSSLKTEFGHYDLRDVYGQTYSFYNVGVARSVGRFTLAAAYHDTIGADDLFDPRLTDGRVVLSLGVEF